MVALGLPHGALLIDSKVALSPTESDTDIFTKYIALYILQKGGRL
jgi:hypothetical protein